MKSATVNNYLSYQILITPIMCSLHKSAATLMFHKDIMSAIRAPMYLIKTTVANERNTEERQTQRGA